ncbi:hypothetical protein HGP28_08635 [Vibrio sp. SM6]|uniref:Uncharacterized protein n=1 Tax=Vibrio agarilyticus TaxID=2726741 RepID=A0A7X8YGW6_9VIBR|nr:hypothetical protein [Vibrio agarilyticus]NLS12955.1 hypothetical protein [Vibrio agarilyticus]
MKKTIQWSGIVGGVLVLCLLSLALGLTTAQVWYLWPLEVLNGITFSLAFGLGFPVWLSYTTASVILVGIFYLGYRLGTAVARYFYR